MLASQVIFTLWIIIMCFSVYAFGITMYQFKSIPADFFLSEKVNWNEKLNPSKVKIYCFFLIIFVLPFFFQSIFIKITALFDAIFWLLATLIYILLSYYLLQFKIKSSSTNWNQKTISDRVDEILANDRKLSKQILNSTNRILACIFNSRNVVVEVFSDIEASISNSILTSEKRLSSLISTSINEVYLPNEINQNQIIDLVSKLNQHHWRNSFFKELKVCDYSINEIEKIVDQDTELKYLLGDLNQFKNVIELNEPFSKIIWKRTVLRSKLKDRQALLSFLNKLFKEQLSKIKTQEVCLLINTYFEFNEVGHDPVEKPLDIKLVNKWSRNIINE